MNPNQIKIDTYKELIEFLEKELNLIRALPDEIRQIDAGKIYGYSQVISHLKGRIEELEK